MIEKLFELKLPSGFRNNGTKYQSRDRWYKGNHVRFYQGNVQPTGGWVERALTGATISGLPNAAISWQVNTGATYLAVGTSTNLYVISAANVVYDITPATVVGDGLTHLWQLDIFGQYLTATFSRAVYADTPNTNAFYWTGNTGAIAVPCYTSAQGPGSVYAVVVTPERFMVILRGADPLGYPSRSSGAGSVMAVPPFVTPPIGPVSPF